MKKTPLYNEHLNLKARMVPFAGFEMPVQYSGVVEEHHAVRKKAGLFDVSHMGEFLFEGCEAQNALNHLTANDVSKLADGMAQYSLLCNEAGGIVDDILVYRIHSEKFLMVVNASNIEKDFLWIKKNHNGPIINISNETVLLAFQGPCAIEVMKTLTESPLESLKPFHFCLGKVAGEENCLIARTGYTGEDGVEIFCNAGQGPKIWRAILEKGSPLGVKPCGLGARDTLRLEATLSLYGHEINDETNPLEAKLGWVVKLEKEDFIGKKAIEKIKGEGLKRKLVGFRMIDKGIPREGFPIADREGKPVGSVTSGTFSPTLNQPIGLGYLPISLASIGSKFNIDIRGKLKLAEGVATPFYKRTL